MGSATRGDAAEAAVLHALVKQVFLTPIDAVAATEGRLRFEPPRNNQRKRIGLAADFEIDTWTDRRLASLAAATQATNA